MTFHFGCVGLHLSSYDNGNNESQQRKCGTLSATDKLYLLFQYLNEADHEAKKAQEVGILEQTLSMQQQVSTYYYFYRVCKGSRRTSWNIILKMMSLIE